MCALLQVGCQDRGLDLTPKRLAQSYLWQKFVGSRSLRVSGLWPAFLMEGSLPEGLAAGQLELSNEP